MQTLPEKQKRKPLSPLTPKFILASILIYLVLFFLGGPLLAIPLFHKICGGGVEQEFIFLIYWGLILLVGYLAICTCVITEYIASLRDHNEPGA